MERKRKGRRSTILTGPLGLSKKSRRSTNTLLGNHTWVLKAGVGKTISFINRKQKQKAKEKAQKEVIWKLLLKRIKKPEVTNQRNKIRKLLT